MQATQHTTQTNMATITTTRKTRNMVRTLGMKGDTYDKIIEKVVQHCLNCDLYLQEENEKIDNS